LNKAEKKAAAEAIVQSKSVAEASLNLNISLGRGEEIMEEIAARIRSRQSADVFEGRAQAKAEGQAVNGLELKDEESTSDIRRGEVGEGMAGLAPAIVT